MLSIQTNWARSYVRCLSLRLRFPEQEMLVFVLGVTLGGLIAKAWSRLLGSLLDSALSHLHPSFHVREDSCHLWKWLWSRPPAFNLCVLGTGEGLEEVGG